MFGLSFVKTFWILILVMLIAYSQTTRLPPNQRNQQQQQQQQQQQHQQYVEFHANYPNFENDDDHDHLNYKFLYYIDHAPSKVHMLHREERLGDYVTGQYGLLEANGYVRSVHYEVNGQHGFHSVVRTRSPHSSTLFKLLTTPPIKH